MHFPAFSRAAVVQKYQELPSTLRHGLRRCNYHSWNPYLRGPEEEALPLGRQPGVLGRSTPSHQPAYSHLPSNKASAVPDSLRHWQPPLSPQSTSPSKCLPPSSFCPHQCPGEGASSCRVLVFAFLQAQAWAPTGHCGCASGF